MKKLTAVLIAATFAVGGIALAQDKKQEMSKKPTTEECKKAADAKKKLEGCEEKKSEMKK
jgi:Ni/Co efflux regulator RcnB